MKRQIQKVGVRKWFGDDFINLQDELYDALEAIITPYGNFIIKGCEIDGSNNIAPGIVCLDGKIARFEGASSPGLPCYLSLQETEIDNRVYQSGSSLATRKYYQAVVNTTIPGGSYLTINTGSNVRLRDAIQSSSYRFASDTEKAKWNGGVGSGLNADLLDGYHANSFVLASSFVTILLNIDGAGSGVDADLLDGQHGAYYLPASSYTAADILTKIKTVDGAGSGLDADLLDGQHGSYYLAASSYTAADVLTKIKTVDGTGSGLDADLLDGLHSSSFLKSTDAYSAVAGNHLSISHTDITANLSRSLYSVIGRIVSFSFILDISSTSSGARWTYVNYPVGSQYSAGISEVIAFGYCNEANIFCKVATVEDSFWLNKMLVEFTLPSPGNYKFRVTGQYRILLS